ncbi:MAG: S41 family peptidase [Niabella sp.]
MKINNFVLLSWREYALPQNTKTYTKMKNFFLVSTIAVALFACRAGEKSTWNLDFEQVASGQPTGWKAGVMKDTSVYKAGLDSTVVHRGRYAASIEYESGKNAYSAWSFVLPENYDGRSITLTGYVRTEGVSEGFAGLFMRIDPQVGFDNMADRGIKGTTGWKKYSITLPMDPGRTKKIVVGGMLVGKGKMWMDDLVVSIDGKDISTLKPVHSFAADRDASFQDGSGLANINVAGANSDMLYKLGLIWGFLKYYHPRVINGEYNWDFELFRILPRVVNAKDEKEAYKNICAWVGNLGDFKEAPAPAEAPGDVKLFPDLAWITGSGFPDDLTKLLLRVKGADRGNMPYHYYVDLNDAGGADFKNENDYAYMAYPDEGFRLLTLYRYWNMIQYFFPYRNLIGTDWKLVLRKFVPEFTSAKDELGYKLSALRLVASIHDTHAGVVEDNTIARFLGERNTPLKLSFVEGKAVVTGYYNQKRGEQTGLRPGDVILKIGNKTVAERVGELGRYISASNQSSLLRDITFKIMRSNDSVMHVQYQRGGKKYLADVGTYNIYQPVWGGLEVEPPVFKWVADDIAYLDHGRLKAVDLPDLYPRFKGAKGLIIDMRNYPADDLMYELPKYLNPSGAKYLMMTYASVTSPGLFKFRAPGVTGRDNKDYFKGKVVVLVNEKSQSSSEFHAMAYRTHPNCIVVGSTTAGADGNTTGITLPAGLKTRISGAGVYYPDGRETQRVGIVPDITVRPTISGIINNKDEVLDKAIELIQGK